MTVCAEFEKVRVGKVRFMLLVVPKANSKDIIEDYYCESSGEPLCITKTTSKIQKQFYWVQFADVTNVVLIWELVD